MNQHLSHKQANKQEAHIQLRVLRWIRLGVVLINIPGCKNNRKNPIFLGGIKNGDVIFQCQSENSTGWKMVTKIAANL